MLSLALLVKERRVYFDSEAENAFLVFKEDIRMMRLSEQGLGIYVHNIKHNNDMSHNPTNTYNNIILVMFNHDLTPAVETALASYTKHEVAQACLAREQMHILRWLTQKYNEDMIAHNTLYSSTVMIADICRAYDIFGPLVPALQGKTLMSKTWSGSQHNSCLDSTNLV